MKNIGLKISILPALVLLIAVALMTHGRPAYALSGNAFQAGDIIDNSVFFNTASMNANDVQAFLNSKVPTCDTNGTQPSGHAGYNRAQWGAANGVATPYICLKDYTQTIPDTPADAFCAEVGPGTKSAAQIISEVSTACKVNPQVMLVLLQKEQGLVTDDWPWPIQYRSATGYGCPDTAACDADYYGFFNQVYNAAHQYQRYAQQPQLFTYKSSVTRTIAYNPNASCGGSDVYLQDQATANLYNYTPYQPNAAALANLQGTGDSCSSYGNRNFWYYFSTWFGSPTGDLVRTTTDASVYLVTDTTKYPISDGNVLNDFTPLGPVRYVNDAYLNSLFLGSTVGRMVRSPDGSIYLVNAGIKLAFSSCGGDIIDYGYTCSQPAAAFVNLTDQQIGKFVNGPNVTKLVKSNADSTIYYMSAGTKRPFTSWSDLTGLNIPITYNVLTAAFVNGYTVGPILYGPGSLVKTAGSSTVYVVEDTGTLLTLGSFNYSQGLGLNGGLRTISSTDFQQGYSSAASAVALTDKVKCSATNYVGINGSLYSVSSGMATNYGYSGGDFLDAGAICPNLKVSAQSLGQYIRVPNGTIYYVTGGQKHAFTSMSNYQSSSYCNNACTLNQVTDFFAGSIVSGANL